MVLCFTDILKENKVLLLKICVIIMNNLDMSKYSEISLLPYIPAYKPPRHIKRTLTLLLQNLVTKGYSSYKPHPNFGVLIQCFVMGSPQRSTSQAIFNSCNGRNISCTPMHTSKTSTCNGQTLKKTQIF